MHHKILSFALVLLCFFTLKNLSLFAGENDTLVKEKIKTSAKKEVSKESSSNKKVYQLNLKESIFPAAWRKVDQAIDEAEKWNADYFLLHLNTYGGAVDMADSIRTKLLKATPTTLVLINNNAASAGALISLACDSIYMVEGAQMGAATVVNETGQQMPDKYQSYMRATMRSTAQTQGRDPEIAEAMVDDRINIPGIIDSAKTLTFTTEEAIKHNYCEAEVKSVSALIEKVAGKNAQVKLYSLDWKESLIQFLLNPMVSSLLMIVMFLGIYAEVQSPGVGFPILAAIIAATLYFAPNYLDGLADSWEILLFIVGIILLALELLVIPGTGVAGILGVAAMITGLTLSLLRNDLFDFSNTGGSAEAIKVLLRVSLTFLGSIILLFAVGDRFFKSTIFNKMILDETQGIEDGYTIKDSSYEDQVGNIGIAVTDLKITGRIEIGENRYEAITNGDFIEQGEKIKVIEYKSNYFVVKKWSDPEA